jgi:hypothetical protein
MGVAKAWKVLALTSTGPGMNNFTCAIRKLLRDGRFFVSSFAVVDGNFQAAHFNRRTLTGNSPAFKT